MPNHITNIVRITAEPAYLLHIRKVIAGDEHHPIIDFNKILPMPEELSQVVSGFCKINGEEARVWREVSQEDGTKVNRGVSPEELQEWIRKYGANNWYDWSINNWGTKWNAYAQEDWSTDSFKFDTAWATPALIFEALSTMFPEASFYVEFADEDMGNNCGTLTYSGGELIEEINEADNLRFACEVKGYDYDEYMAEIEED